MCFVYKVRTFWVLLMSSKGCWRVQTWLKSENIIQVKIKERDLGMYINESPYKASRTRMSVSVCTPMRSLHHSPVRPE